MNPERVAKLQAGLDGLLTHLREDEVDVAYARLQARAAIELFDALVADDLRGRVRAHERRTGTAIG